MVMSAKAMFLRWQHAQAAHAGAERWAVASALGGPGQEGVRDRAAAAATSAQHRRFDAAYAMGRADGFAAAKAEEAERAAVAKAEEAEEAERAAVAKAEEAEMAEVAQKADEDERAVKRARLTWL